MKACQDCRHVYILPESIRSPRCHHPKSFTEQPDYLTGEVRTAALGIELMRALSDLCGQDAKLFEPKE